MRTPPESNVVDMAYELGELRAEVARHHQDFTKIARLIDRALNAGDGMFDPRPLNPVDVLREIRGIVG